MQRPKLGVLRGFFADLCDLSGLRVQGGKCEYVHVVLRK